MLLGVGATPAAALTLVDGDATLTLLTGPQDFRSGGPLQSDTEIFVFQERDDLLLASDVTVNVTLPGTYSSSPGTSVLPAGIWVDVFLLHMDTTATVIHGAGAAIAAEIRFDSEILGVIGATPELDASDAPLGDPASLYLPAPSARHTWETDDILSISADRRTLTIERLRVGASQPFADQVRVLVAPEPGSALLALASLLGLAVLGRR